MMQDSAGLYGRRLPSRTEPARPAEGAAGTKWRRCGAEPVGGRSPRILAQVPAWRRRLQAGLLEKVVVVII